MLLSLIYLVLLPVIKSMITIEDHRQVGGRKCSVLFNERNDCGYLGISAEECRQRGCCWVPAPENRPAIPWCFHSHPSLIPPYYISPHSLAVPQKGNIFKLQHRNHWKDPSSAAQLNVKVEYQSDTLRLVIYKGNKKDNIVPSLFYQPILAYPMPLVQWTTDKSVCSLQATFKPDPFQFSIQRRNDPSNEVLFNTEAQNNEIDLFDSIIFKNNYVELGTQLPYDHFIVGLGERASGNLRKGPGRYAMNARDYPAFEDQNTYGAHPFYIDLRADGRAHGVLFLNSHPMEVEVTSSSLIFRALGGIIDIYFFAGPTIDLVMEQYTRLIGRPPLYEPKYFGLHQCRFGYRSLQDWKRVITAFEAHQLPLDGICYMNQKDIFTVDPVAYPLAETRAFLADQERKGRFLVTIVDPGVSIKNHLPAYQKGIEMDIFVKSAPSASLLHHSSNNKREYYVGHVWPGRVHFVDFTHPDSTLYWKEQLASFRELLPFAGLWLDMCEPADMGEGDGGERPHIPSNGRHYTRDYPPYAINNGGSDQDIFTHTISMNARHYLGVPHLAVHNVYGLAESLRTAEAMEQLEPGRRHFLLTRSTFVGSGRFTAHWLGDNFSDFSNLKMSIIGVIEFQLYGISMVGADLCGFLGTADMELCARWMALGAFMPFARNHNAERPENINQEPYMWPEVAEVTRRLYAFRYSFISYWNTLQYYAHKEGRPIIRAMFFDYPSIRELRDLDEQFMVGYAWLVAPVVKRGMRTVKVHLPVGVWYDAMDLTAAPIITKSPSIVEVYADLITLPVFLRGGSVLLRQQPAKTIRDTLRSDYTMIVALDEDEKATGTVYFDDGISSNPDQNYSEIFINIVCLADYCTINVDGYFGYQIVNDIREIIIISPKAWRGFSNAEVGGHMPSYSHVNAYQLRLTSLRLSLNYANQLPIQL